MPSTEELFHFNGINGSTGKYLTPPSTPADLLAAATGEQIPESHKRELEEKRRLKNPEPGERHIAPLAGLATNDLAAVGWGVIFAQDADPAIQKKLKPLLDLRRDQAQKRFYLYAGNDGYLPGDTK